jgi:hypothetical protein
MDLINMDDYVRACASAELRRSQAETGRKWCAQFDEPYRGAVGAVTAVGAASTVASHSA